MWFGTLLLSAIYSSHAPKQKPRKTRGRVIPSRYMSATKPASSTSHRSLPVKPPTTHNKTQTSKKLMKVYYCTMPTLYVDTFTCITYYTCSLPRNSPRQMGSRSRNHHLFLVPNPLCPPTLPPPSPPLSPTLPPHSPPLSPTTPSHHPVSSPPHQR